MILTFLPHCSHRMQQLDATVCGPFKRFYASFVDSWQSSNPSLALIIYGEAGLSGKAFYKALYMKISQPDFGLQGFHRTTVMLFGDDACMLALITDQLFGDAEQNENNMEELSSSTAGITVTDTARILEAALSAFA